MNGDLQRLLDTSAMRPEDKARLKDLIRVLDGGGTMEEAREAAGLTPGQAATMLGLSREVLTAYERGALRVPEDVRARMLDLYDVAGFVTDDPEKGERSPGGDGP